MKIRRLRATQIFSQNMDCPLHEQTGAERPRDYFEGAENLKICRIIGEMVD